MPWFDARKRQWGLESWLVAACGCARTKHLDQYRIALSELGKLHVVDGRARKRGLGGSPWDCPRPLLSLQQDSPVRRDDGRCFRDYVIPEAQTNDRWLRNFWKCARQETARFGLVRFKNFIDKDDSSEESKDKNFKNYNKIIIINYNIYIIKIKYINNFDFDDKLDLNISKIWNIQAIYFINLLETFFTDKGEWRMISQMILLSNNSK